MINDNEYRKLPFEIKEGKFFVLIEEPLVKEEEPAVKTDHNFKPKTKIVVNPTLDSTVAVSIDSNEYIFNENAQGKDTI